MFQADTDIAKHLRLVQAGRKRSQTLKGVIQMNEYKFAEYPSNSTVASGVTFLVSAWFLVAAGAILTDPLSVYTQRPVVQAAAATAVAAQAPRFIPVIATAPDARFTITVEAKRLKV